MCKHVAAVLDGVGARLDRAPETLFTLRGVDPAEMVETAVDQPRKQSSNANQLSWKTSFLARRRGRRCCSGHYRFFPWPGRNPPKH
jgi:uncharacterized Zn finger protein